MDLEPIIQRYTSLPIPLSRSDVIDAVASVLHSRLNAAAQDISTLYEEQRRLRCQNSGQLYTATLKPETELDHFPVDLFKNNIQAHGLDPTKWTTELQKYAKTRSEALLNDPNVQSLRTSEPPMQILGEHDMAGLSDLLRTPETQEALQRLRLVDNCIEVAMKLPKDPAELGKLGVPVAGALAPLIGVEIAAFALAPLAIAFMFFTWQQEGPLQRRLRHLEQLHDEAVNQIKRRIEDEQRGRAERDGEVEDANRKQDKKRQQRDDKKRRKEGRDEEKKKRRDYYFGCVDRIEELASGRGWEIRMDGIAENTLSDNIFVQELQKVAIATNPLGIAGLNMFIITIYLHNLPPEIKEGVWVNFKLDTTKPSRATKTSPDLSRPFSDGLTILEKLNPRISFRRRTMVYFLEDDYGSVVQADTKSFNVDLPATVANMLRIAFNGADGVQANIQKSFNLVMNVEASASVSKIKQTLSAQSSEAKVMEVLNVGQGASAVVRGDNGNLMFASDFGYGKGEVEPTDVCQALIYGFPKLPILLSHWDSDHYRIAISPTARDYTDTAYDCRMRTWITPTNMTGTVAPNLYNSIDNLLDWPSSSSSIQVGNIKVHQCIRSRAALPDKNNLGALALVLGTGNQRLLYPGDANFECISGIEEVNGNLLNIIATHHGSERSLEIAYKPTGYSIPRANANDCNVIFSYGAKNHFGHDLDRVFQYYQAKGFSKADATARLSGGADTIEITIAPGWNMSESSIRRGTMPSESAMLAELPLDDYEPQNPDFRQEVVLTGVDQKYNENQDDLAAYAVRDEFGDIVSYNIIATKLVLQNLPLCVPCLTDFPVDVRMQCNDIEIQSPDPTVPVIPIIRFNVANGPTWVATGNLNQTGREGESGFAGGYLNLSVAGDWVVKSPTDQIVFASDQLDTKPDQTLQISIQYRGGRGSHGQKGGRGSTGAAGSNGTDDSVSYRSTMNPKVSEKVLDRGRMATPGSDGGLGATGGNAGKPGIVKQSVLTVTANKVPRDEKMLFTLDLGAGQDAFANPASYGPGGDGGPGGPGGIEGKRLHKTGRSFWTGDIYEVNNKASMQATNGRLGPTGTSGKGPSGPNPREVITQTFKPLIMTVEKRTRMLAGMSIRQPA